MEMHVHGQGTSLTAKSSLQRQTCKAFLLMLSFLTGFKLRAKSAKAAHAVPDLDLIKQRVFEALCMQPWRS